MTASTVTSEKSTPNFLVKLWAWIRKVPPVYPIFLVIFLTPGFSKSNRVTRR